MKRVIAAIAVLISVMCFAYAYRLQVLGMIQTDVVAVSDRNLAKTLQKGADGDKEPDAVMLEKFQAGDTVYQRGSNLYLGEKKERIQSDYPFYTGDGTGIWYFQATGSLITDDFMEYEPYAGLYVSDGTAFDEDGVGQDEDTYIFAKLNNGLYMNTVPVTIQSNGMEHSLRLGSLISFREDSVSSYAYAEDRLVYSGLEHLSGAKVVIRDKTYDYESFLKQLGVIHDAAEPVAKPEETAETVEAESGSSEEADRRSGTQKSAEEESAAAEAGMDAQQDGLENTGEAALEMDSQLESAPEGEAGDELSYAEADNAADFEQNGANAGDGALTEGISGSNGGGSSNGGSSAGNSKGSSSGSGGNSGNSTGGDNSGQESGSNTGYDHGSNQSGSSNGGGTGTGGGSNDSSAGGNGNGTDMGTGGGDQDNSAGNNNNGGHSNSNAGGGSGGGQSSGSNPGEVRMPIVAFGNASADVYNVYGELAIQDPDMRLRRVVLRVYREENGKEKELITRKNFKNRGNITIPNVWPDTSILIQGTFVWTNTAGEKVTVSFMDDVPLHTLSLDHLAPYTFTRGESANFYEDRIRIPDMQLTSSNPADLLYISRGNVEVYKKGESESSGETLALSGSDIRALRQGKQLNWISDGVLKSGTDYEWHLTLTDRFGNALPHTNEESLSGSSRTCYKEPSVSIALMGNAVGTQRLRITLINEDKLKLSDGYMALCDVQTGKELAVFGGSSPTRRALDLSQNMITEELKDLPSGQNYRVEVHGTYDSKDTEPNVEKTGALLGQTIITTASISNLGTANYVMSVSDITASSATVKFNLSSYSYDLLIQLISQIKMVIAAPVNGPQEVILNRSDWENVLISSLKKDETGTSYVLYQAKPADGEPEVLLNYLGTSLDTTVWEAIKNYTTVEVRYPEGKLNSKTQYKVNMKTTVTQAQTEYDVSASNSMVEFQTMRKAPQIRWKEALVISDFAELYDFRVDDPDGTITDGYVNMRLYAEDRLVDTRLVETNRTYSAANPEEKTLMSFQNLSKNMEYTVRFYAAEYNDGYSESTLQRNYEFPKESWLKFATGTGITGKVELRSLPEAKDNKQIASIRVTLTDPEGDLSRDGAEPAYILEYRKLQGLELPDAEIAAETPYKTEEKKIKVDADGKVQDVLDEFDLESQLYSTYELRLIVKVKGHRVTLDTLKYETGEEVIAITKESDFALIGKNLDKNFVVLNDIDATGAYYGYSTFEGHLDFQGYALNWNVSGKNQSRCLFTYIGSRGVVENVELNYTTTLTGKLREGSGLCYRNLGTIRNVIAHIEVKGRYPSTFGGLVYNNYASGVIENVALQISSNGLYVAGSCGGISYSNDGTVRNSYVYGGAILVGSGVYGGDNGSGSRRFVGGIVGNNSGGIVYNCFTLNQIQVEQGNNMDRIGLAVGENNNNSRVRNVLSVGDIYRYHYEDFKQTTPEALTDYGGTVGYVSSGVTQNIYLLSELGKTYGTNGASNYTTAEAIEARTLRSASWHEDCFNSEGAFDVEDMVQAGYYPRLALPDSMMSKQDMIGLPLVEVSAYPDIISSTVIEEGTDPDDGDYALVDLEFYNPNEYQITGLDILGVTTSIQLGQGATEKNYHVTVKLTNPTRYRSSYTAATVYYKGTGTIINKYNYQNRSILVSFYKPIKTVNDWETIKDDAAGNYRLEDDIDFSSAGSAEVRVNASFSGVLDGKGHVLKHVREIQYGNVFSEVNKGTIKDLAVEGLSLSAGNPSAQQHTGFVGTLKGAGVLDHVFIMGEEDENEILAYGYSGALAAEVNNATVRNCGVKNMQLTTSADVQKNTLYLGGLVGSLTASELGNCYAEGITINAETGYTAAGVGGLIGVQGSGSPVSQTYAQGTIRTSFQNAGGLIGSSASKIQKAWTQVDINSIADNIGGIAGRVTARLSIGNVVELGNMYTTSSNISAASGAVRRIVGSVGTYECTRRNAVAYSGQLLGKEVMPDVRDANRLVALDELWGLEPYRDYAVLGSSFDISGLKSGYTANEGVLPMLLDTQEELLPYQEPVSLPDPSLSLQVLGRQDKTTGEYSVQLFIGGAYDKDTQKELYEVDKVEVPGLNLMPDPDKQPEDHMRPDGSRELVYSNITVESHLDSYQTSVTLRKAGGGAVQVLTASLQFNGGQPLYHEISTADEFIDAMNLYGKNYENFRINANIDLTGRTLPMNLKLNRLVGSGDGYEISGIKYEIRSQGQSLIEVLTGTMQNLTFKDVTATAADRTVVNGGKNVGLISLNQGEIRNMKFDNVSITAPVSSTYTGVIGSSMGTLKNIELKNIRVSSTGSYTGGLCGEAFGTVDGVTAVGTKAADGTYQYSVVAGQAARGNPERIGGLIGSLQGEAQHLSADGIKVVGGKYVGGLVGYELDPTGSNDYYGYRLGRRTVPSEAAERGARQGVNLDADGNEIVQNQIYGYEQVGGIFGNLGQSGDKNHYNEIYNAVIDASYQSAGGYTGTGAWDVPDYIIVEDVSVHAQTQYAGGVHGLNGEAKYILVNHVTVSGGDYVSGGFGYYAFGNYNNCLVENSVITGGSNVSGYMGESYYKWENHYNIGVYNCSIQATGQYAGGLFALLEMKNLYNCFVSQTDVTAEAYAGGFAGELHCGYIYDCESNANVTATAQGAGGLAGRAYSYFYNANLPSDNSYTSVYRNIITGTVTAGNSAGGLFGQFTPGSDRKSTDGDTIEAAPLDMEEKYFYSNLMALSSIEGRDYRTSWIAYNTGNFQSDSGQMKNSFIWGGSRLTASDSTQLASTAFKDGLSLPQKTGISSVTSSQMKLPGSDTTSAYRYVTQSSKTSWSEEDVTANPAIMPYSNGTSSLAILQESPQAAIYAAGELSMKAIGAGIPVPEDNAVTQSIPEAELPTVDIYASGAGTINLEFDRDVTKDAENGFGMRPVVDGEPEDGEAVDESAETGAESESENRSGGSAVQSSGSRTARAVVADADSDDEETTGTAQNDTTDTEDADILYDMDAAFAYGDMEAATPEYRVRILSGGEVLADEAITGRVMTFSYDYQTPLTAEVTDGFNSEQYEIDPEALAHSVMVYGDSWYYLTAGGVGTPDGVVAGEYIHLFNGSALDLDGNITDLGGGSGSVSGNAVRMDTTPLYEWDYAGYDLLVFKNFTWSVDDAAEAVSLLSAADGADELSGLSDADDEVTELPYQAIVKNGEMSLFNAENPVSPDGWIIDNYQGESFMTVLGEDGKLADIGQDEIKMPEDFQNSYIGEVSNTAYADAPIVVGRYNSGKVFAFNYLTGENLEVVQSDDDMLDLVDYAKQWISDKTDSMFKSARTSYLAAANLGSNVDLNEVKRLYDGTNGSGTQNSIAGVLRGNTVEGAGGDPGQSDSGVRSNEQKEAGDGNGTAGGTTAANTVQTGEAGDGGDKTGSETGAKKNGVQSSKNDGADLNDSEDADEAEDAEDADEESSESKKSSKNSSVKKAKANRAKSNVSDSEKESPESESLKKETSKSDSKTQSDSEKDSQAAVQSGEDAKAALDGTQTDVEKSADRKTGTGPAGDTAAEREKAGTGGRSGEAGNGAEPSGSEAGAAGQTGTEAGAAGSTGTGQSGTEAGSAGAGQSGTEAGAAGQTGAEAGAAGDAASGQTGTEAGAAGSTGAGQSGTEAGAAGQAGADANAAGSAASGQTGTKLGTDKVAAAISSHDAERTKEALNSSWLPVYDAASGEYKLYNAGELLSSNGGVVLSAEEKMEALSRQGINVNYGQVNAGAHHTDSEKQGFKILGGIAAAILLILGSFWLRRRNAK